THSASLSLHDALPISVAYAASWGVLFVLTTPLLVCAYVYNLVPPYNASPPPLWAEVLLYVWICSTVGLMGIAAALLLQIRCPSRSEEHTSELQSRVDL